MKQTVRIIMCILFICTLLLPNTVGFAADVGDKPRKVRVACGINNALYLDENGKVQGYCGHYIRQIAWLENWELEYVNVTWAEGLEKMKNGELDLMFPLQKSDERDEFLDFSDFIGGYEAIGLYARSDSGIAFNEYEALDGKIIGVEKNSLCADELSSFASANGFTYTLSLFDNASQLSAALTSGEIDMLVSSTMDTIPNAKLCAVLQYKPYYYAVKQGDTGLLSELNKGMKIVFTDSPDMAVDVFESTLKGTAFVGYTKNEEQIIADTDKITVAMYDNTLPLAGSDKDGNVIGIYADLLKKVEEITGITMEPVLVSTDDYIFDYLDSGKADYVMCSNRLPYTSPKVYSYLGSDPIASYETVAVSRPGYNLDSAKNPVFVLTTFRTYLEPIIHAAYPDAEIITVSTAKDCLVAIQQKKADVTYINSWEYNYQSKNSRFSGLMEWENTRVSSDLIVVTTASKNEEWLGIVDKAFHQIPAEETSEIITQNVNMPYSSFDSSDRRYSVMHVIEICMPALIFILILIGVYLYMRRKNISALKEKNRELEKANEAKSAFLSRMSHELRTPLNAISGFALEQENNCLSDSFDVKSELKSVSSIRRAVTYQQSIIGDLLNMRLIESGKMELNLEEVDAASFMDEVVEMIKPEAQEKSISFEYDRLTSTNETYLVDPVRLQQILFNLLHNAIKFTPDGGNVRLTAKALEQNGDMVRLCFTVSDTGIGMSPEFLENGLFRNFAQEHTGNTSPYEGCGIGLYTCRELVKLMDGSIQCRSEQGKGTEFTVEITAKAQKNRRKRRDRSVPIPRDLKGVKILLCEDNKMNQEIESRLLQRFGCEVDIAENGKIGCEMFKKSAVGSYNIILMDIRMPEMDGLEATKAIRAMQRADAKLVPVFAVSANAFEEDVKKSLEAGLDEHLAKPMDVKLIHEKILFYMKNGRSE